MNSALQIKSIEELNRPDNKLKFNEIHFTESAPRYDIATRLLSLGKDGDWKRFLIDSLPTFDNPKCLDLACGTGDLCFALGDKFPTACIEGVDLTEAMLQVAHRRNTCSNINFSQGDMCHLSQADNSFDIVTGSYALRNAPDLPLALSEITRVLKPGGIAAFLDFSKPKSKFMQAAEYWLLRFWGSLWGLVLHGNPAVHGYISASLKNYPDRLTLQQMFHDSGLEIVMERRFFGGITEVSMLRKPS